MSQRTLLAVHAHPDDETITMGGTLARYSAAGVRTIVVTCTNGSLGEVRDPSLTRRRSVADLRTAELEQAAKRLGVSRLASLGYNDSGMAGWPTNTAHGAFFAADLDEAATRLATVINQERPDVLLTYDATGGYGHPDHVKTHQVTLAAFKATGPARPAKLYYVRLPITWARDFATALRQVGIDAPQSAAAGADNGTGQPIGVPDDLVTTEIDVRAYVTAKRQALACHASQMPPEYFLMRMPEDLAHRLWAVERYSREAGPTNVPPGEIETDLFAGLD